MFARCTICLLRAFSCQNSTKPANMLPGGDADRGTVAIQGVINVRPCAALTGRHRMSVVGLVALMLSLGATEAIGQSRAPAAEPPTLDSALLQLVATCAIDATRPKTPEAWAQLVRATGLVARRGDDVWNLQTASGRLGAFVVFAPRETQYWFVAYPEPSGAIPDSVLSHLLRQSTFWEIQGEVIEIGVPAGIQSQTPATVTKSLSVSLVGGRLLSSRTTVTWKDVPR